MAETMTLIVLKGSEVPLYTGSNLNSAAEVLGGTKELERNLSLHWPGSSSHEIGPL